MPTNQLGKKTISKGFGLGRLHHSSECHLNHSRLGMLHTITSSRWRPKQKVTSVFPGFFRKWNGFCLDPKKQRAVLVVAAKEKKKTWQLETTLQKGPPRCPGCGAGHGTSRSGDSTTCKSSDFWWIESHTTKKTRKATWYTPFTAQFFCSLLMCCDESE